MTLSPPVFSPTVLVIVSDSRGSTYYLVMRPHNLESLPFPLLLHCFFLHQYPHVVTVTSCRFFTSSCVPDCHRCLYFRTHVFGLRGYFFEPSYFGDKILRFLCDQCT